VNSGSSANLLAFASLCSKKLGDRAIGKGDEVITVAAGFPTTVTPILQYGAIPVFVDVSLPQYNIDIDELEKARSKKTKAVFVAHTMGNPFDIVKVKEFCDRYNLWLVEDNCDSLGSLVSLEIGERAYTGSIGDIGTSSFYPPHHITTGEGGAVYSNNAELMDIVNSLRDWGRDCKCRTGEDDRCGHRFEVQYGELPKGYDHKYVFSNFGYSLRATDMQAAIGCAQIEKLPEFTKKRQKNWDKIYNGLAHLSHSLILPEKLEKSSPSWFGFIIMIKEEEKFNRDDIVKHLESKNIQTRMLFAGNIIKHPCFDSMRKEKQGYRVVGDLTNTDRIMRDTFWIGVHPGLTEEQIGYMVRTIEEFVLKSRER